MTIRLFGHLILLLLFASSAAAAQTTNVCAGKAPTETAPSAGGVAGAPLVVTPNSHVAVLEYEAWFGPNTANSPPSTVTTCLQSADMAPLGGGYDSIDPVVIAQHVQWIEQMGVDAITLDLSNNTSCIFDGDNPQIIKQVCSEPGFRRQNIAIRSNDVDIYRSWAGLQTRLKIIPLLGGFDPDAMVPDKDDRTHRTAVQKEVEYFGALMRTYPNLSVIYQGKPLMMIYLGTPIQPPRAGAIKQMLSETGLDAHYTIKLIGGYLDSQQLFWTDPFETPTGPIEISSKYDFWSIVDRINFWGASSMPYYPTYNLTASGVENMTASLATAGQYGWICPTALDPNAYCPDAALRYCGEGFQNGCRAGDYETLAEFMVYARALKPTFLILDQFNEFATPDEGSNANSNDDAEPTKQWGYSAINAVVAEMKKYRADD